MGLSMKSVKSLCLGIGLMAVGIGLIIGCYYLYDYSTKLYFEGLKTTGKVVDYQKYDQGHTYEKSDTYYPVIEYTTNRGIKVTSINKTGFSETSYYIDEEVEIYYAPMSPKEVIIYSIIDLFIPIIALGFGSIILLLFGSYYAYHGFGRH